MSDDRPAVSNSTPRRTSCGVRRLVIWSPRGERDASRLGRFRTTDAEEVEVVAYQDAWEHAAAVLRVVYEEREAVLERQKRELELRISHLYFAVSTAGLLGLVLVLVILLGGF